MYQCNMAKFHLVSKKFIPPNIVESHQNTKLQISTDIYCWLGSFI